MWYEFSKHNSEALYGWTTDPDVAKAALKHLNRGVSDAAIQYYIKALSDRDDEAAGGSVPLKDRGIGYVCDDDTGVDDFTD